MALRYTYGALAELYNTVRFDVCDDNDSRNFKKSGRRNYYLQETVSYSMYLLIYRSTPFTSGVRAKLSVK